MLSETSEWYEVDQIPADGSTAQGWVDRDDLHDPNWVLQRAETRDFRFRADLASFDPTEDDSVLLAIEVLDKSGARIQVLRDIEADAVPIPPEDHISLVDANFDGFPDIMATGLPDQNGGPNFTHNIFLFDPVRRRFVFEPTLSELPRISFDGKRRTVHSVYRKGAHNYSSQTFRYFNKTLTLVGTREEILSVDGEWFFATIGRLHKGKMRYHNRRTRAHRH
ncbi:hypothetical protein [Cupriavidus sp. U2]|uniref:XAC2610-related protein n=1 Tax=Cupriavidus sp. U2 TaxID=2920269 RepID=UPI00129EE058|nr:hypothetical protein [Cupriavidus sp. U2]